MEQERRRTSRKRRGLGLLAIVLVVLTGLLAAVSWIPLRQARGELRAGRAAQAIADGNQWSRLHLWPNQYHQVLAAANLTAGNREAAQPHLNALRGKRLWLSVMPKREVANRLFRRGSYDDFLAYDAATNELSDDDETMLYRAASLAAIGKTAEAENALKSIDRADVDAAKLTALERAIAQRRQGTYPYVMDRDGKAIASFQMSNNDVVAVDTNFAPLIEKEAGELTIEAQAGRLGANDTIDTTLDSAVQDAAVKALGGFRGSLVAIDPRTNEVLAIASTRGRGPMANLALDHQYEPGSVMKILTGLNAIENHLDVNSMFPYNCTGDLLVDGRHFGDWLSGGHGTLPDLDEAFAESCNVVFADIGVRLGVGPLRKFMTSAGFDGQADLGLFRAPLGRTTGEIFNKFETAFYAIGLEHETSTSLHLAMIASMMANRGVLTQPRLMRARRSILGEVVAKQPDPASERVATRDASERMIKAMIAVVTRDKGTGRRAPIDGVTVALKTGTAGKREEGYHAVIVAFAPVDQPKIAFALVAEDSGPAEFAGAKIAHDFMQGISARLK